MQCIEVLSLRNSIVFELSSETTQSTVRRGLELIYSVPTYITTINQSSRLIISRYSNETVDCNCYSIIADHKPSIHTPLTLIIKDVATADGRPRFALRVVIDRTDLNIFRRWKYKKVASTTYSLVLIGTRHSVKILRLIFTFVRL